VSLDTPSLVPRDGYSTAERRVVLVPGVLALLPEYASLEDPVAELRAACRSAVAWLGSGPVVVLGDEQGARVGRSLVEQRALASVVETPEGEAGRRSSSYLVVGNGSACRSEKAPGHLDERAAAYDDALRVGLSSSDVKWLDLDLGNSLLASLDGIAQLPDLLPPDVQAQVDYDDDPFGVQYWVLRWQW
jgi:hypothetical protein